MSISGSACITSALAARSWFVPPYVTLSGMCLWPVWWISLIVYVRRWICRVLSGVDYEAITMSPKISRYHYLIVFKGLLGVCMIWQMHVSVMCISSADQNISRVFLWHQSSVCCISWHFYHFCYRGSVSVRFFISLCMLQFISMHRADCYPHCREFNALWQDILHLL